MWYKEFKRYFGRIKNLAYEKINERSFDNPHPWAEAKRPDKPTEALGTLPWYSAQN